MLKGTPWVHRYIISWLKIWRNTEFKFWKCIWMMEKKCYSKYGKANILWTLLHSLLRGFNSISLLKPRHRRIIYNTLNLVKIFKRESLSYVMGNYVDAINAVNSSSLADAAVKLLQHKFRFAIEFKNFFHSSSSQIA